MKKKKVIAVMSLEEEENRMKSVLTSKRESTEDLKDG